MWGSSTAAMLVVLATACAASPEEALVTGEPPGGEVSSEDSPGMERATPPGIPARVTRVVDGDTFEARIQGEIVDVRIIGIDAPETVHPTEPVECFGPEASAFTERRLEGSRVLLELDIERIDTFGRTLAYVWKGNRLINEDIIRMGYATLATYPPNVAHVERLAEAERKARRDGLGIWDACLVPIDTGADWRDLSDA